MSPAARMRAVYVAELVLVLAAVVGGAFPGLISLSTMHLADDGEGVVITFSRFQLVLSMALSVPIAVLLLTFVVLPGHWLRTLRVQGIVAVLLLLPSAISALVTWNQPEYSASFAVHPVLRLLLVVLPFLALGSLATTFGGEQRRWLGLGLTMTMVTTGSVLNVAGGFMALMEISDWV